MLGLRVWDAALQAALAPAQPSLLLADPHLPFTPPLLPPSTCSAGPGPGDLNTVAYTYTSSVDLVGHPNAGLIGVMAIGAPGALDRCAQHQSARVHSAAGSNRLDLRIGCMPA